MKKLILIILILLITTIHSYSIKPTTYTNVQRIGGRFFLNYQNQKPDGTIEYYPMALQLWCEAITTDGGVRKVSTVKLIGKPKDTKYTNKEIYNRMPQEMKSVLKDLINEAISEDISSD